MSIKQWTNEEYLEQVQANAKSAKVLLPGGSSEAVWVVILAGDDTEGFGTLDNEPFRYGGPHLHDCVAWRTNRADWKAEIYAWGSPHQLHHRATYGITRRAFNGEHSGELEFLMEDGEWSTDCDDADGFFDVEDARKYLEMRRHEHEQAGFQTQWSPGILHLTAAKDGAGFRYSGEVGFPTHGPAEEEKPKPEPMAPALERTLGGHFGDNLAVYIADSTTTNFLEAYLRSAGENRHRLVAAFSEMLQAAGDTIHMALMDSVPAPDDNYAGCFDKALLDGLLDIYLEGGTVPDFPLPGIIPLRKQFPGLESWYATRSSS